LPQRFIAEGAEVFITGRRQPEPIAAVNTLGPQATGVRGDVGVSEDLDRLYATVAERGNGLDIVFVNAGITEQHLDLLLTTNVKGAVFTVQKALPLLHDNASVILNGSIAGDHGREGNGTYAATKATVRSFARTWANELRDRGIRVNAVVPGTTATPGIDNLARQTNPDATLDEFRAGRISGIPLGRLGDPVEIANAILLRASDLSSYITGAALPVDGGSNQI
jgi:NAD(P)-dependent dehydrogenase (short-subunit alcohol dehydrogenase family)